MLRSRKSTGRCPETPWMPISCPAAHLILKRSASRPSELLADYNQVLHVTPELDARFAALAAQRIRQAPLRYYVWLPLLRIADMWLRPRTETLPSDTRWWEFNDDPKWSALAVAIGNHRSGLSGNGRGWTGGGTRDQVFRATACVSGAAISLFRYARESRASLHLGVLSRGDHSGRRFLGKAHKTG